MTAKKLDGVFEVIECSDAETLLDNLRLSKRRWLPPTGSNLDWHRPWIFRGQRDSRWPLLPSTWRPLDNSELTNPLFRQMHQFTREHNFQNIVADLKAYRGRLEEMFPDSDSDLLHRVAASIVHMTTETLATMRFCGLADQYGYHVPEGFETIKNLHFSLFHHFPTGIDWLNSERAAQVWSILSRVSASRTR